MARTQRLADPNALWLDLARMYESQALHAANLDNSTKADAYTARATAAREKAATYAS